MPSSELMVAFLATTMLFAYMPGPALLYAAAQTVARGRKAGLMAALGLHIGGYVHVVAAAAGLSALFHAVPTLYFVVKAIGAGYLVWLGARMIWRAYTMRSEVVSPITGSRKSGRRALLESVTVEVLNPKTALFFYRVPASVRRPVGSLSDLDSIPGAWNDCKRCARLSGSCLRLFCRNNR